MHSPSGSFKCVSCAHLQWVKSVLYVEQKIPKINIVKIYFILIQYVGKMMMTDENAKISLFPRVRRPAVRPPLRKDP
ncbi:hypothetical protein FV292_00440 [Escherichia coli]|nr:hypothetical protein FV292_00440 [Escherichia coli]